MQHGGLARRIFDEAPGKGVPPEEAAQMLRDYIAPSLDTTISTAAYLTWHFADSPDQWQLIREDKSLICNAVEEVVRLHPDPSLLALCGRGCRDTRRVDEAGSAGAYRICQRQSR